MYVRMTVSGTDPNDQSDVQSKEINCSYDSVPTRTPTIPGETWDPSVAPTQPPTFANLSSGDVGLILSINEVGFLSECNGSLPDGSVFIELYNSGMGVSLTGFEFKGMINYKITETGYGVHQGQYWVISTLDMNIMDQTEAGCRGCGQDLLIDSVHADTVMNNYWWELQLLDALGNEIDYVMRNPIHFPIVNTCNTHETIWEDWDNSYGGSWKESCYAFGTPQDPNQEPCPCRHEKCKSKGDINAYCATTCVCSSNFFVNSGVCVPEYVAPTSEPTESPTVKAVRSIDPHLNGGVYLDNDNAVLAPLPYGWSVGGPQTGVITTSGTYNVIGPFSGIGNGFVDGIVNITQQFRCGVPADVSVSYRTFWCGDTEEDDYVKLFLNDIEQTSATAWGFPDTEFNGYVSTDEDDALIAASNGCDYPATTDRWRYADIDYSSNGIAGSYANPVFSVRFDLGFSADTEWGGVAGVNIRCTAIPTITPTQMPSRPTRYPSVSPSVPSRAPTPHPPSQTPTPFTCDSLTILVRDDANNAYSPAVIDVGGVYTLANSTLDQDKWMWEKSSPESAQNAIEYADDQDSWIIKSGFVYLVHPDIGDPNELPPYSQSIASGVWTNWTDTFTGVDVQLMLLCGLPHTLNTPYPTPHPIPFDPPPPLPNCTTIYVTSDDIPDDARDALVDSPLKVRSPLRDDRGWWQSDDTHYTVQWSDKMNRWILIDAFDWKTYLAPLSLNGLAEPLSDTKQPWVYIADPSIVYNTTITCEYIPINTTPSPTVFEPCSFPDDILHRWHLGALQHWDKCYHTTYSDGTTADRLDACVDQIMDQHSGLIDDVYIFVGAIQEDDPDYAYIGAYGHVSVLQTKTTAYHRAFQTSIKYPMDTYWYYVPGVAFGFSDNERIHLMTYWYSGCDMWDLESTPNNRLCWHMMDAATGGWRAGNQTDLNYAIDYQKVIYYKECNATENPTLAPTRGPTLQPTFSTTNPTVNPTNLPTTPTVTPTKDPTRVNPHSCGLDRYCWDMNVRPVSPSLVSTPVTIQDTYHTYDTYYDITFNILGAVACQDPSIDFTFERIDNDNAGEYLWLSSSYLASTITCGGTLRNYCNEHQTCVTGHSLGVVVQSGQSITITVHRDSTVDAFCTEYHSWSINAVLTLNCDARTDAPTTNPTVPPTTPSSDPTVAPTHETVTPTDTPTEQPSLVTLQPTPLPTVEPTLEPTIYPTEDPTDSPTNVDMASTEWTITSVIESVVQMSTTNVFNKDEKKGATILGLDPLISIIIAAATVVLCCALVGVCVR
eukprot:783228_1